MCWASPSSVFQMWTKLPRDKTHSRTQLHSNDHPGPIIIIIIIALSSSSSSWSFTHVNDECVVQAADTRSGRKKLYPLCTSSFSPQAAEPGLYAWSIAKALGIARRLFSLKMPEIERVDIGRSSLHKRRFGWIVFVWFLLGSPWHHCT